ncbi:MAG TPA: LacI family DNA-binding transcriptional regulator [Pseudonocardiaceae bacterium]|jgi:DNA-binding LacI/PurR family transcriptional regulator|nr:LacI family DNA-binding transcriptional regulator [Pseudonocardiaceae bacterium]
MRAPEDGGLPVGEPAQARRPTLAAVARRAGVSTATASRVLNRSAGVSGQVLIKVERAVRELGYVRQRAPSAQRGSGAVCVVVFDDMVHYQADSFYGRLLVGAERAVVRGGRELVVLTALRRSQRASLLRFLCGGHVDGVVMVGMREDDGPARLVRAAGVPVSCVGRPPTAADLPYVDADNRGGAVAAVRHLVAAGRTAPATIAGPKDMIVATDRLAGFQQAMADNGFAARETVFRGDFTAASGEHAMLRLLERSPDTDAVFVASDLMALGALRALRRRGIRVPEDIAVVGFDDDALARRTAPPLTTVRQPVEEMGALAVAGLLTGETGARIVPTTLVVRESA